MAETRRPTWYDRFGLHDSGTSEGNMVYLIFAIAIIMVLLYFVPKRAALILTVVAAMITLFGTWVFWMDMREQERFNQVSAGLMLDRSECPKEAPLRYQLENNSQHKLYRVFFRYSIYRKGYSTAVSRSYRNEVTADKILEAGASFTKCIALPEIPEEIPDDELEFRIDHKRVWFEPPVI